MVGAGEGFAVHGASFEGQPAVVVDCGTLADLLAELEPDDDLDDAVSVLVFGSVEARHEYVREHRYARREEQPD